MRGCYSLRTGLAAIGMLACINLSAAAPSQEAYLRLWLISSGSGTDREVRLEPSDRSSEIVFQAPLAGSSRTSYREVARGNAVVTVQERTAVLASEGKNLRAGSFYTCVIRSAKNRTTVEWWEDDPSENGCEANGAELRTDRDAAPSGQKRVLPDTQGCADACPGLRDTAPSGLTLVPSASEARLRIFSGGSNRPARVYTKDQTLAVQPNSSVEWRIPAGATRLGVVVASEDGSPPAESVLEFDAIARSGISVWIVPDYRGRFRPRVFADAVRE